MSNELTIKDQQQLSSYFVNALDTTANLPDSVDKQRLAINFISLLQDKPELKEYGCEKLAPLVVRCAKDNLDVLNNEVYIYKGYGGKLTYTPSYKGLQKMAIERSIKPIKQITTKVLHEGDTLDEEIINGEPHLSYKSSLMNKKNPVIGVFCLITFKDGTETYEILTKEETDKAKAMSKNSGAWKNWEQEMMRKVAIRRATKHLSMDFNDKEQADSFIGSDEIIDDPKEQAAKDIQENANKADLDDEDIIEVVLDESTQTIVEDSGQQSFVTEE